MSLSRRLGRRSLLVGAGAAALLAAGTTDRWLPVPPGAAGDGDPVALRARILAGVPPHTGLATATGRLGLPAVPPVGTAGRLLSATTRIRVQLAAPDRWRVDELTPVGEVGTYRDGGVEQVWDYGANRLTTVTPPAPVRFPRASDLAPADLARRLLGATPDDPVTALAPRRVAGLVAAGLRVTPADPNGLAGRIDVWAVPVGDGALPVAVEVAARPGTVPGGYDTDVVSGRAPLLATAFTSVAPGAPPPGALVPAPPSSAERVRARPDDLTAGLRGVAGRPPPDRLAGRDRAALPVSGDLPADELLPGVAVYGTGVGRFVLVPAGPDVVDGIVRGSAVAGGVDVPGLPGGTAVRIATPLLTLVVARRRRRGVLLAGPVRPAVLEAAAVELVGGGS
ncbi:hypothetical protein [Pseudonocardia spirodelae]|uniref:MucB/RseB N-terminal domain-containing protein n=1 Tax=Pseudonocardia spirodelae TaxID=3133431 RepID=A0ABU8T5V3_9PSEU